MNVMRRRPAGNLSRSTRAGQPLRRARVLVVTGALLAAGTGLLSPSAGAAEAVVFPGGPLTVYVGPLGQCQSSYLVNGVPAGNFFLLGAPEPIGDCGFFLQFPSATGRLGQPAKLATKVFGFSGAAGPHLANEYTRVSQSPVTGAGTEASPYTQTTVFKIEVEGTIYAQITETTTYVNGQPQFISTYVVKNLTATKMYFRAIYAGDLYVNGNDVGTGVFLGGPPRFIGGQNTGSGVLGGFVEAGAPALPWSSFQEAYWSNPLGFEGIAPGDNGIWHDVEENDELPKAFNETIEPKELDNAAGVEWDQLREGGTGLAAGAEQAFTVINKTQIPSGLRVEPATQTVTAGQAAAINVTSIDTAGAPYAGRTLRYTIAGANPATGSLVLNGEGKAQIAYIAHNPGIDTVQMFVDLGGSGIQTSSDPSASATVTVLPPPANSSYTIKSIKANADGTITIVFVPVQNGTASVEVTVPTGTIARKHSAKKCKKGQVKIKGKCLPKNTGIGSAAATGTAGVPLTITVKLSGKARAKLNKGKTLHVVATLTYKSALGGTPTVSTYNVTVKGKKPKHHGHKK